MSFTDRQLNTKETKMNNWVRTLGRLAACFAFVVATAIPAAAQPVEIQWWHAMSGTVLRK